MQEDVIEAIAALREAQTVRQILAVDMPKAVWKMPHAEAFREAFLTLDLEDSRITSNVSIATVNDNGDISWSRTGVPDMFNALQNKVIEAETKAAGGVLRPGTKIVFKAGTNKREITALHADYPNNPNNRMYLFRTDTPTLCLSHKNQSDVVEKEAQDPSVLDRVIPAEGDYEIRQLFNLLDKQVRYTPYGRALNTNIPPLLEPLQAGELTVLSGAAFHQKQGMLTDGPAFHAVVYDPQP